MKNPTSGNTKYFTGLDLGQASEYTGLAVLEQKTGPDPEQPDRVIKRYAVRFLKRFDLGTPFPAILAYLREKFSKSPLEHSTLVVDQTGVGEPVVRLLRRESLKVTIRPLTITAGDQGHMNEAGLWSVPKKELVSSLQILLQSRRIKFSRDLPETATLERELAKFRSKVTLSSNATLEDWREGPHDDLILAVAIAAWQSDRLQELWVK